MGKKEKKQKQVDEFKAYLNRLGVFPAIVAEATGAPNTFLAFSTTGYEMYEFKNGAAGKLSEYKWDTWTNATVDHLFTHSLFTFKGNNGTQALKVSFKSKDVVALIKTNTNIHLEEVPRKWWNKILGFRSRTKWKMVVATMAYLVIIGGIVDASNDNPTTTPTTTPSVSEQTTTEPAPVVKTAEEIQAENDKKAAAEYQRWIDSQFSVWDGSHIDLVKLLKENLNDPKSFEHVETTYVDNGDHLIVKMTYRAKNGFGGLVLQNVTAKADYKTNTISIISQND